VYRNIYTENVIIKTFTIMNVIYITGRMEETSLAAHAASEMTATKEEERQREEVTEHTVAATQAAVALARKTTEEELNTLRGLKAVAKDKRMLADQRQRDKQTMSKTE
jgi:hypothetical protein